VGLGYPKPRCHLALPHKGCPAISGSSAAGPLQLRHFQPAQKQDQLSQPKGLIPADPDLELSLQVRPVTPIRFLDDLHLRPSTTDRQATQSNERVLFHLQSAQLLPGHDHPHSDQYQPLALP
jgi:hypothetical protein